MSYHFEASKDFQKSLSDVEILLDFAEKEGAAQNDFNRKLFLKLCVVSLVTKFQVYIQKILEELLFQIRNSKKRNKELPLHSRLNSIKLLTTEYSLSKQLMDSTTYNGSKYREVHDHVFTLSMHCDQESSICKEYLLNTKFPMGKRGVNELLSLFKQFEGKDNIFESYTKDIEKLNGILEIRHNIVHQDADPSPLTEVLIRDYMGYIQSLADCIDDYLNTLSR